MQYTQMHFCETQYLWDDTYFLPVKPSGFPEHTAETSSAGSTCPFWTRREMF